MKADIIIQICIGIGLIALIANFIITIVQYRLNKTFNFLLERNKKINEEFDEKSQQWNKEQST